MFAATSLEISSNKEKEVYSGYGIAFDGKGQWSFGNDYARNVIFGVDNSSWCDADNLRNNLLVFVERDTFDAPGKIFSIIFSKTNTKFCLSLHYNFDNSYLFVNGK